MVLVYYQWTECHFREGDSFLCFGHRHKHAGGIQTSLLYSRLISQTFPGSNRDSMITFVLCLVKKDSNVIYGKIFKGFYFFHLVVAMVSTAKSTVWAQHKSNTEWSKWERQTDNKSWQNLTLRKAWNVWCIKSQIGNMEPVAKFIEMETKEKWKWMQPWEYVGDVCMCEGHIPSNVWNTGTGTCKRCSQRAGKM